MQHLQNHQAAVWAEARATDAVVCVGCDDTSHLRAVAAAIAQIIAVRNKIPAVDIRRIKIRVGPQTVGQVGVVDIKPRVNHGDDDVGAALRHIPGGLGTNARQSPLYGVARVVRCGESDGLLIEFGKGEGRGGTQGCQGRGHIGAGGQT